MSLNEHLTEIVAISLININKKLGNLGLHPIFVKRLWLGQQVCHRGRNRALLYNSAVFALQGARMRNSAGMGDQVGPIVNLPDKIFHPHRLFCRVEAVVKVFVMRRDPRRASVLVAFQRLNAAQREHETTC